MARTDGSRTFNRALHSTCATQRAHVAPLAVWVWEADAGCRDSLDVCDVVPAVSALKSSLLCSQAHANTAMTRLACGQSHSPVLRQAGVNSRNATNGERGTRRPPCSRETRMISALRPCSPVRVHLLEVTVLLYELGTLCTLVSEPHTLHRTVPLARARVALARRPDGGRNRIFVRADPSVPNTSGLHS